ncbi:MAG: signal peptidase II [Clostridiales bacterium]|nr:signal peptidase II [Clostridiales bacterium]
MNANRKPTWITYVLFSEVLVVLVFIDQFTKDLITKSLALSQVDPVIKGFFSLMYVQNKGSAFSMFSTKSWGITFLSVISAIAFLIVLFLAYFVLVKYWSRRLSMCLIFLAAGTLGNLIDRVRLKYVVDFLRFDFGSYTFPIFNVADICVTLSCIALAVLLIFNEKFIPEIPFADKEEEKPMYHNPLAEKESGKHIEEEMRELEKKEKEARK